MEVNNNLAVKIAVIESEAGWGRKIDDWMVCLTVDAAEEFKKNFNASNNQSSVPNWYMQVEGDPIPINLNDNQYAKLQKERGVWLSSLKHIQ